MRGVRATGVLALLVALSLLIAAGARGQDPPPESLPSDTVATVDSEPILKADFDHWLVIAAAASDAPVPNPGTNLYATLRDQVVPLLISFAWIEGEAADRSIALSDRAVRREFRRQKREAFPRDADYRKFLRDTRQTTADILQRIRLSLLADRIRTQVAAAARTPRGRERRVRRFVRRFNRKWRAVTICGEGYATDRECSSTVPIAEPSPTPTP